MAGFQNFTPRTANLAKVWEGFNPAANFLGGMKAVQQMDLDKAAEERLRESAEVDRRVKETLLPLQVEEARANIALSMAGAEERAARARYIGVGGMKQLSARQQRYDAEIDPEGVQKGTQIIGTWGEAPASAPSSDISYDENDSGSSFQFDLGGDDDNFLGRVSEDFPNPAANLSPESYAVSTDPKETMAGLTGGAMQAGQAGPAEVSQINALAKSGDEMASQFKNPLSEFKTPGETANPLNDFDVDPASAMQSTLDRNKNAFGGKASKQQPKPEAPSLGGKITKFKEWDRNAQRTIRQLDKSSPYEAQLASRAYNDQLGDFYAENFNGLDEDEINFLMKNPSKADRYIGYKEDFGPEEASWLSKINPSYADGVVRVFKDGKLPDGTSVVAESLEQSKMIYDNAIRQGMKPTQEENAVKQIQDRQVAMKNFFEIRNAANENPEDKTLQATYQLSLSDMKSLYGDEWKMVEFGLNQQDFHNAFQFRGQKVDIKGKPVEGLNAKTADQVRMEMFQNGQIPLISSTIKDGKEMFDDDAVKKLPEGSYFGVRSSSGKVNTYQRIDGGVKNLDSTPAPSNEETPLDASIKEIEAKEAVANAESNKKRIQEIDREIAALSSTFTERRESSFSPMGYSAPVSSRAKNKDELVRDKNRILDLKKLKASLLQK